MNPGKVDALGALRNVVIATDVDESFCSLLVLYDFHCDQVVPCYIGGPGYYR